MNMFLLCARDGLAVVVIENELQLTGESAGCVLVAAVYDHCRTLRINIMMRLQMSDADKTERTI